MRVELTLGPNVVGTAVSGAEIELSIDNLGIAYGPLVARDDAGRELVSTMSLEGDHIVLEVDDTGATYPVINQ